jgi:hypothetical protein
VRSNASLSLASWPAVRFGTRIAGFRAPGETVTAAGFSITMTTRPAGIDWAALRHGGSQTEPRL